MRQRFIQRRLMLDPAVMRRRAAVAQYLLDAEPGATRAYGMIRLAAAQGAPIRAERVSDGVQADVWFDGAYVTESSAVTNTSDAQLYDDLVDFLAGSDGRIVTFYDPAGNAHATNATAAAKPLFARAGRLILDQTGTFTVCEFDAVDDVLTMPSTINLGVSSLMTLLVTRSENDNYILGSSRALRMSKSVIHSRYAGGSYLSKTFSASEYRNTRLQVVSVERSGAADALYSNGVQVATAADATNIQVSTIGRGATGTVKAHFVAAVFYTDHVEGRRANVETILAQAGKRTLELRGPRPGEFGIVQVPDLQAYTQGNDPFGRGAAAGDVLTMFQWIEANKASHNIKLVYMVGDLANDGGSLTQLQVVKDAITNSGLTVPVVSVPGNHDDDNDGNSSTPSANRRSLTKYNSLFGQSFFTDQAFWQAADVKGFYEAGDSANWYATIDFDGDGTQEAIIFGLEHGPRDAVIAWIKGVLDAHPGKDAYGGTHSNISESNLFSSNPALETSPTDAAVTYTSYWGTATTRADAIAGGFVNVGEGQWSKLWSLCANIRLVLNGHHARGAGRRVETVGGTKQLHICYDPMMEPAPHEANGGRGILSVIYRNPAADSFYVQRVSTKDLGWLTSDAELFGITPDTLYTTSP